MQLSLDMWPSFVQYKLMFVNPRRTLSGIVFYLHEAILGIISVSVSDNRDDPFLGG